MKTFFLRSSLTCLIIHLSQLQAFSCPVCLGDPDAPMTKGISVGILLMLGILGSVFTGFAGFVFFIARRAGASPDGPVDNS